MAPPLSLEIQKFIMKMLHQKHSYPEIRTLVSEIFKKPFRCRQYTELSDGFIVLAQ